MDVPTAQPVLRWTSPIHNLGTVQIAPAQSAASAVLTYEDIVCGRSPELFQEVPRPHTDYSC